MSADLLIAAAVDLSGGDWFLPTMDRITASLALGLAGEIRHGMVPGAALAARKAQPLHSDGAVRRRKAMFPVQPDGSVILLAGRIMERAQLASRLGVPATIDDASLYGAAWLRFGEDCDSRITGDYAVIHWLADRRRLRLARSPLSNAPLHVWRAENRIVAASIPRAIFAAGVPARIEDARLADAGLLNFQDYSASWYAGLHQVGAGHAESHTASGSERRQFWSVDMVRPVRFRRDEDYVEAVDEQFRKAVRETLEGAGNPAILLSGGFDSQAVASYAAECLPPGKALAAYTSVPKAGWDAGARPWLIGDESAHVRALCAMYPQIEPEFIDAQERRFGDRIDRLFLLGSWPTHNEMNMHWWHVAMERARQRGCDVMLTGAAGNAGFSYDGLTGFPTWLRQGKWLRLCRELRLSKDARPMWRRFASLAAWPHVPHALRKWRDRSNPHRVSPFRSWCPLREDFARSSGALDRARSVGWDFDFYDPPSALAWRREVLASLSVEGPPIQLGLRLLYGVECRDPTAYLPLLELCMGIPDEQYLRNGVDRWLGRRLLAGRVPEMVWSERRSGMQAADWPMRFTRDREDLLAEMEDMARDPRLAAMFDFARMTDDLRAWSGKDDVAARALYRISVAIGRGVATARFVRYVEGRNAG